MVKPPRINACWKFSCLIEIRRGSACTLTLDNVGKTLANLNFRWKRWVLVHSLVYHGVKRDFAVGHHQDGRASESESADVPVVMQRFETLVWY